MAEPIDVIGIGADGLAGLRPELIQRIRSADFLAGGARHLSYVPEAGQERFSLKDNLMELLEEISRRFPQQRCVVLASGDPLFYGVGKYLAGLCGRENVRIEPNLSSMQLAFARAALPWDMATLASIHGRNLRTALLPLLGRNLIGLLTHDGDSPAKVARFFLERGLRHYQGIVGENLGAADEKVTRWADMEQLATQRFAHLNYLILKSGAEMTVDPWMVVERRRSLVPGVSDDEFLRPSEGPEVMTRQEVRSVVVGKLSAGGAQPGEIAWDLGSGLGTVAVELAVLRSHLEVVAVECDAMRAGFVRKNRERFGAFNIRVVEGTAPEALAGETERPRFVFLGGSGPRLAAILDCVGHQLLDGGRLVANFVTLEHLALTLDRLKSWGWPFEITEVHVSRSDALAGLTGLKPQRGVFIVSADKRGPGDA